MTGPGRPTKLTPELQDDIVRALGTGATRAEVSAFVRIAYSTFYRWMERGEVELNGMHASFREAVLQAESRPRILVRAALVKAAQNGNVAAIKLFLSQKAPKEFEVTDREDPNAAVTRMRAQLAEFISNPLTCAVMELEGFAGMEGYEETKAKVLALLRQPIYGVPATRTKPPRASQHPD